MNAEQPNSKQNDFDLGARLRYVRQAAGLSQRELAKRAGMTNAAISVIENNQSSPSVASLKKVLEVIPLSLTDFFALETPAEYKIFFQSEELVPITQGAVHYRQVGDMRYHNLQILHERYTPGADTGRSMLQHESEEGGIILEGMIELTVGERKTILKAGDAYLFDSRQPHRFRNIGKTDCVIVSACTPPYL
ncbi:MAG: cupin domain-containing protein [Thiolinea sp.]